MFYTFRQNNSGGSLVKDDLVSEYVIIEANSHVEANDLAEDIGIYFNGCASGRDCPCCGDRWYAHWSEHDAYVIPAIYGEDYDPIGKDGKADKVTHSPRHPKNKSKNSSRGKEVVGYVYYKDGYKRAFNVSRDWIDDGMELD